MVAVPSVAILILFISEPGPGWGGHYHTLFIILESRPSSYGARDGNDVSCNNNVTRWLPSAPAATCWHGNNGKNMNSKQGHYVITAWLRSCRPRHYHNTWHSVTSVTRSQARIFIHQPGSGCWAAGGPSCVPVIKCPRPSTAPRPAMMM